jgi:hypothetical protein
VADDLGEVTTVGVDEPGLPPLHKSLTIVLNNHSYMPVSLNVPWREAVWMCRIRIAIDQQGLTIRGSVTDHHFIEEPVALCDKCEADRAGRIYRVAPELMQPPCLNCRLRATLPLAVLESRRPGKLSFPKALFKITEEEARKVPTCPQGCEDHDRRDEEPQRSEWVVLDETDTALIHKVNPGAVRPAAILALNPEIMRLINEFYPAEQIDDLADILAMNRGGFVNAGPGTGKTRALMPRLIRAIQARNPEAEIYKVAPTYVAAKQMRGGITCQAAVHRLSNNRVRNVVLIVDEVSMCNTAIMEAMARWSIQGDEFYFLGDFSQLLPVGADPATRWRMEDSQTFMRLCNNLQVRLVKNRRAAGDYEHFRWVMSLRPRVDEPVGDLVHRFNCRYPWRGETIAYYLCISHRNRMRLNKWCNDRDKQGRDDTLAIASPGFMKGCSSQPQDMTVWPGLQLIGGGRNSRRVLNGVVYIVRGFTDDTLQVVAHADFRDGDEEVIELPLWEAAESLRLCYAAVYHSCQGRTLRQEHVLLTDCHNRHFTGRHLYVGASRVTAGAYLHVATWHQTRELDELIETVAVPLAEVEEVDAAVAVEVDDED